LTIRHKLLPLTAFFLAGLAVGLLFSRVWLNSNIGDLLTILALLGAGLTASVALLLTGYILRAGHFPLGLRHALGIADPVAERVHAAEQAQKEAAAGITPAPGVVGARVAAWSGDQTLLARALTPARRVISNRFQWMVQVGNTRVRFSLSLGFLTALENSWLEFAHAINPRSPATYPQATTSPVDAHSTWVFVPITRPSVLLVALGFGMLGQVLVSQRDFAVGLISYLLVLALIIGWAVRAHVSWEKLLEVPRPSRRAIIFLLSGVIVVAFVARFYHLDTLPYGIEGDTKGWVLQSYLSVMTH
jgi:hypothetical protein